MPRIRRQAAQELVKAILVYLTTVPVLNDPVFYDSLKTVARLLLCDQCLYQYGAKAVQWYSAILYYPLELSLGALANDLRGVHSALAREHDPTVTWPGALTAANPEHDSHAMPTLFNATQPATLDSSDTPPIFPLILTSSPTTSTASTESNNVPTEAESPLR